MSLSVFVSNGSTALQKEALFNIRNVAGSELSRNVNFSIIFSLRPCESRDSTLKSSTTISAALPICSS
jgi:hypothetical protein